MFYTGSRSGISHHLHGKAGKDQCIHQLFTVLRLTFGAIPFTQLQTVFRAFSSISIISLQIYSPVRRLAIFQSARQIYFPRRSETPDAVSRCFWEHEQKYQYQQTQLRPAVLAFFRPFRSFCAIFLIRIIPLAAVGTEIKGILYW